MVLPDVPRLLGVGTVTSGLTPALPSSVAPSGIVPPLSEVPELPGTESGEAVPLVETAPDDAQPVVGTPINPLAPTGANPPVDPPLSPPPSKTDAVPIGDDAPAVPGSPAATDVPAGIVAQPVTGAGLRPPGLTSVAPSGTPLGLFPVGAKAPGAPSGEVDPSDEPMLDVVGDIVI
jgi:hypothetical protein